MIIVGIDFGTKGTGFTYSRDKGADKSIIILDQSWNHEIDARKKTETSVLYKNDEPIAFGKEAHALYEQSLFDEKDEEGLYLFKHFKMDLYKHEHEYRKDSDKINNDPLCTSICGSKRLKASKIFQGAFFLIKKLVIQKLNESCLESIGDHICENDIEWIVTVPAIWTEIAKNITKMAAEKAGMTKVKLALEPEAAALTIFEDLKIQNLQSSFENTKFIVVDAGAGTLDIVVLNTLNGNRFEELAPATGGPGGSSKVDYAFLKMFREIFADFEIGAFLNRMKFLEEELKNSFETVKESISKKTENFSMIISIPNEIWDFIKSEEKSKKKGLEMACKNWAAKNNLKENSISISNRGRALKLSAQVLEHLHQDSIKDILQSLENLKSTVTSFEQIKFLFLVGGFSRSFVLQSALGNFCRDNQICLKIPSRVSPDLAVVNGATLFGLNPEKISSRQMRFSYGIIVSSQFNSIKDPLETITCTVNGNHYVSSFYRFVERGENIKVDEERTFPFYALFENSKTIEFKVKATILSGIKLYRDDPSLRQIGTFLLNAPEGKGFSKKIPVEFTMKFGGTSIQCRAKYSQFKIDQIIEFQLAREFHNPNL
jgi:molecular chaperone DnaK (HSP70)